MAFSAHAEGVLSNPRPQNGARYGVEVAKHSLGSILRINPDRGKRQTGDIAKAAGNRDGGMDFPGEDNHSR